MINNSKDTRLNSKRKKRSLRVQEKWNTLATFKDDKLVLMKFNNLDTSVLNHTQTDVNKKLPYFVDSTGHLNYVDFIDTFRKEHKSMNEYLELTTTGEKETTLQKYYRLKFETEELVQEFSFHKDEKNYFNENLCTYIGLEIQSILGKLTKFSVDGCFKQFNDLRTSDIYNSQNYIAIKLLNKILGKDHKEHHFEVNSSDNFENLNSQDLRSSRLNNIDHLPKITQLEGRLQKLETIIGSEKLIMKRLCDHNNDGLGKAILSLRKLSQMNLPQVNVIESKVAFLLPKLKQISINLNNHNVEVEEKINELYKTILRAKEESHLLSNIIQRMTTLKYFCYKVEFFEEEINSIRDQYSVSSKTLINNKLLLNNIETDISKNTSNAVNNLQSLNAQIEIFDDQLKNKEALQVQR